MVMKLYYFDVRNLAEPSRLILHYGNVRFEDIRVGFDEWETMKLKMPYGKIPVLEVDGKQLAESLAISRYLARKQGLAGKTEWEQAKVDEIVNMQRSFYVEMAPFYYAAAGFKEADKADEYRETVATPAVGKYLSVYSEILRKNGTGFMVGSRETYADFWVCEYLFTISKMVPELFNDYPDLLKFVKRIHSLPELKDYIAKRNNESI